MTQTIEIINPLEDGRWQPFVEASPDAGIFHHREWLALLRAQYGYSMHAHCVVAADGQIIAALPLAHVRSRLTGSRLVAVPFSDLCSPASRDGDERAIGVLLDSVRRQHERDGVDVEIRTPLAGLGRPGACFYRHEVSLGPDVEAVRRGFTASTRRAVSKAERQGVEVVRGTGTADLDAFYALHLATRRRQGVPTQPKRFIRRFGQLFKRDLGFVLLARWESQTIAAALFLGFNGVLTYKYGASHPAYLDKRPNNAVLMEAMRLGCANGYTSFDLGRTDLDNEGLRTFKRSWGGRESTLSYTVLSRHQPRSSQTRVPGLVRSFIMRTPPITSRLLGEALYGHFG